MSAVRIAALVLLGVLGAACSGDRVAPSGSTPLSLPVATDTPVATDSPTTTQVPNADTPLVQQAVVDYRTALRRCQQRPSACRPATFTAEQGPLRTDVTSAVETMVTNGWHRADDEDADGYVVVGAVTVDGVSATAEACVDDPTPMLDRAGTVVTTGSGAHHFIYSLAREGDAWKVGDEQIDTTDACAPVPDSIPSNLTIPTT